AGKDVLDQWRELAHAVIGPDRAADGGAADRHAAALVADLGAPAADRRPPSADHGKAGAAGADDEDGAVASPEGAEPGGIGIGIDRERGKGVRPAEDGLPVLLLLRTGKAEAGMGAGERFLAESGCGNRGAAGLHHLDNGGIT